MPPPTSTLIPVSYPADFARERAVKIDDVQIPRARGREALGNGDGVARIDGHIAVFAAEKAHRLPSAYVYRG
jgi:hypothetical protein